MTPLLWRRVASIDHLYCRRPLRLAPLSHRKYPSRHPTLPRLHMVVTSRNRSRLSRSQPRNHLRVHAHLLANHRAFLHLHLRQIRSGNGGRTRERRLWLGL